MLSYVLLSLLLAFGQAGQPFPIERIFTPTDPGGKYKHPAAIEELANGDMYLVFYGGSGEYEPDTAVYGSRLVKGSKTWTTPTAIAHTPFYTDGNAVIWQAPDGVVWLFYLTRYGETWSTSRIKAKLSRDGARTWSDSVMLTLDEGTMVRNRPIVLSDGTYLIPIYKETGADREATGPESTSQFLRFDPKTSKWSRSGAIKSKNGNIQPAPVEISPGHVVAYCRRGGGYGEGSSGYIVRGESRDFGMTWSEGIDTKFPNPNSAVDLLKLQSGRLLLVYNDSMIERVPLNAAISEDGEKSFPIRKILANGNTAFAYPYVMQAKDGKIHIIFTTEKRSIVNRIVVTEAELLAK